MLTPILNPTTRAEEKYNEAQQGTRVPIEQTYGILKNRYWPLIIRPLGVLMWMD